MVYRNHSPGFSCLVAVRSDLTGIPITMALFMRMKLSPTNCGTSATVTGILVGDVNNSWVIPT